MQKSAKFLLLAVLVGVFAPDAASAATDEENQKLLSEAKAYPFKTVTTKEGLNFNIPEDMPIETRNGVTGPIPFEEYLYIKLKKLDEKLTSVEKKLDDLRDIFAATRKVEAEKERSLQEKAGLLSSA